VAQACSCFPKCGGCTCRNLSYARQLEQKTAYIQKLLAPFEVKAAPCQGSAQDACRNKVHLALPWPTAPYGPAFLTAAPTGWCRWPSAPCTGSGMKPW